ncbi:MAG: hypothetical protein D6686_06535, partial [Alphaproteobacteria bacterium]
MAPALVAGLAGRGFAAPRARATPARPARLACALAPGCGRGALARGGGRAALPAPLAPARAIAAPGRGPAEDVVDLHRLGGLPRFARRAVSGRIVGGRRLRRGRPGPLGPL